MQAALQFRWRGVVPGREKDSMKFAGDTNAHWGAHAENGRCKPPVWWMGQGHAGNILAVEGEHDQLFELVMAPDTQRLIARGDQILEDFCWEMYHVGEGAEAFVSTWFEVAGELGNL